MCPGCIALALVLPPGAVGCLHFRTGRARPRAATVRPGTQWGASFPMPPVVLVILVVLVGLALFGPGTLQYKLDVLGFAVCHQIVSHSFVIGGHPLPVCARCTGIYLGAGVSLGLLAILRPGATGLPSPGMITLLSLMFLTMVADGLNSTVQSLPEGHGLWETTNLLRLSTGSLAGMALAFVLYPLFNDTFWHRDRVRNESSLAQPFEIFGYAVAVVVPVALTLSSADDQSAVPIYWLIALLSVGGILLLLTLANTMILIMVTHREAVITSWPAAWTPLLLALLLALGELLLLGYVRGELVAVLGVPLPPGMPAVAGIR